MIAVASKIRQKTSGIIKLCPATIDNRNLDTQKNVNSLTGLVSATIVTFVNGRSYAIYLKNSLPNTISSKVFTQTTVATITDCIKVGNNNED